MIGIKRVYEPPAAVDGYRVLVDRLWPRGLKRENAAIDAWLVDLAPSTGLRTWFSHEPLRWPEFQQRYRLELADRGMAADLDDLRRRAHGGTLTVLYAARDERYNNACVLRDVLLEGG